MANFFGRSYGDRSPVVPIPIPTKSGFNEPVTTGRPGKFNDLNDFARWNSVDETPRDSALSRVTTEPEYKSVSSLRLFVRHIIHIKDNHSNSRLHDRIMLIIRVDGFSYTCLPFCRHDPDHVMDKEHCLDHGVLTVHQSGIESATDADGYFKLCITLDGGRKPQRDVFINLREVWHVEAIEGITFAILGKVHEGCWDSATDRMIDIFARSLKQQCTSQEGASLGASPSSVISEHAQRSVASRSDRQKEKDRERRKDTGTGRAQERGFRETETGIHRDDERRMREKTEDTKGKRKDSRETGRTVPSSSGRRRSSKSSRDEKGLGKLLRLLS